MTRAAACPSPFETPPGLSWVFSPLCGIQPACPKPVRERAGTHARASLGTKADVCGSNRAGGSAVPRSREALNHIF